MASEGTFAPLPFYTKSFDRAGRQSKWHRANLVERKATVQQLAQLSGQKNALIGDVIAHQLQVASEKITNGNFVCCPWGLVRPTNGSVQARHTADAHTRDVLGLVASNPRKLLCRLWLHTTAERQIAESAATQELGPAVLLQAKALGENSR
jgi:hypothetical protein